MFRKDTVRLIRKSFKRFLSLLLIVLIGSSFMMGLLSTRDIMEKSVDRYNDDYSLQDIQLYSSYGFDGADTSAIRKQEWVDHIFASRMRDVFSISKNGDVAVTRIEETDRAVNKYDIIEGRMPENSSEVLILNNTLQSGLYNIGDELKLYLEDDDVLDIVERDKVTIVGIVRSPAYMCKTLGTSTLKNLELDIILYTVPSAFKSEYYTTVYMTVKGARSLAGFGKEYDELIGSAMNDAAVFSKRQSQALKKKLVEKYTAEIQANEAELESKKAEGQLKLDEAQQKLEDANIQLLANQAQLDSLTMVLRQGQERLEALTSQYTSQYATVEDDVKKIEEQYGKSFDEVYAEVMSDYGTYTALKSMSDQSGAEEINAQIAVIESDTASRRERLNNDLYPRRSELQGIMADPASSEAQKAAAATELTFIEQQISEEEEGIALNDRLAAGLREISEAGKNGSAKSRMDAIDSKYGGSVEQTYRDLTKLSRDRVAWETIKSEMDIAEQAVSRIRGEISSLRTQINRGKKQYEAGLKEYNRNLIEFNEQIEKAENEIKKAYQDLNELPDATWTVLDRDKHYSSYMYSASSKQMGAIGISLPVMFFLVAALVCLTTMTRLVDEQRGQIGIFRAMGFSKAAVIGKYVFYAFLASAIGCSVGVWSGMAMFPTVIYRTWRLLYDLPDMAIRFPVGNALICFGAFTILMTAVTARVTNRCLKEMPSQLMRPKAPGVARKVFLEYIPFLWKKLSFTGKITARNIIRYKARFFMTVIGVAGCAGLLVVGWGIKDSIKDVVNIQFGEIMRYEYVIGLENDHDLDGIIESLESDLGNEEVVPFMKYSTKMYLENREDILEAQIVDARQFTDIYSLRSKDLSRHLRLSNSGAILSEKFASNNKIREGDYVIIESNNGIKAEIRVEAICEMYFQHYIYISKDLYEALFDEPVHYNTIAVRSTSGAENIEKELEGHEGYESVVDFTPVIGQFNTMIRALDLIILVIIITAAALAFVVLVNLTQVNLSERIREIATLKVLGFRQLEVESYLFKEIFMLTFIGALAGLPTGLLMHHFIMNVINMDMVKFGMVIRPHSYLYAFLITLVFSFIVLLMTRKSIRDIEMVESLKSVE